MSDNEASMGSLILSVEYGEPGNIGQDVDLFERFYGAAFRGEACERFAIQVRRQCLIYSIIALIMLITCLIPLTFGVQSIFVNVLLLIGLVPFGVALFYLYRFVNVRRYCEKHLDSLLDGQFASSRSVSKRVFTVSFFDSYVEVEFGTASKSRQVKKKEYSDLEAVFETDDLFFIKGLTWLSKFQMSEGTIQQVGQILKEKLQGKYVRG